MYDTYAGPKAHQTGWIKAGLVYDVRALILDNSFYLLPSSGQTWIHDTVPPNYAVRWWYSTVLIIK